MNPTTQAPATAGVSPTPYEDAKEQKAKMLRKMLFLGYEMGYDMPRTKAEKYMERTRLNYNHVESWCLSEKCCVRKTLKSMSVEDISKALTQFEQVYKSFKEEYKKAG